MTTTTTGYEYTWTECDNCGADVRFFGEAQAEDSTIPSGKYISVDSGWCLDFSGHYAGFTDAMNDDAMRQVTLCHGCSLAVARLLPGVFKKYRGWHPSEDKEISCCEFGWKHDNDELFVGDGNGSWLPLE